MTTRLIIKGVTAGGTTRNRATTRMLPSRNATMVRHDHTAISRIMMVFFLQNVKFAPHLSNERKDKAGQ
jgi:hypothetical protein